MSRRPRAFDPLRIEVFAQLFSALCEEMGAALERSAFSPNIVERRDFSCALFDAAGRMIGQAAHLPVHLGSQPRSVQAVAERFAGRLAPGDAVLLNDPFAGGTHLPDLTLVTPVFLSEGPAPEFFVCSRAHHADIGGPYPGSMGPAADIHSEGLRLPPIHLVRGGELDGSVLDLVLANARVPDERRGDLLAQVAAGLRGRRAVERLAADHGLAELVAAAEDQLEWTRRLTAAVLGQLPDGRVRQRDVLELPDGATARIELELEIAGERARFDFRGTDPAVAAPFNAPRPVAEAAVFYGLRLLLPEGTPTNAGVVADVELETTPGSLVDARYPAAVAAGNVETSQRLVDVILGALGQLVPERIPAASAGTMSNLSFGAAEGASRSFTHYETHAGGLGAGPGGAGASGCHGHMTNTRNTPVEEMELRYPVEICGLTVRRGSGGRGKHRGGDGIRKRVRLRDGHALASLFADRHQVGAPGLAGGGAGKPGRAVLIREGRKRRLAAKESVELAAGDIIEVETPGGGGFGE